MASPGKISSGGGDGSHGDRSGKGRGAALGNMGEVERVFRRFDANGDGKISSSELAGVVRALAGPGAAVSDEEVRRMMEEMDTDRDGYVNLAEFSAFHRGGGEGEGGLREAFRMYDLDGDGRISPRELQQVLERLGDKCSDRDCSRMISSVDADGDGCVDFQEFKKMMTGRGGDGSGKSHQPN